MIEINHIFPNTTSNVRILIPWIPIDFAAAIMVPDVETVVRRALR